MNTASTYNVGELLRGGRPISIRAIRPSDKQLLLEAFKGLDENTIRSRFFGHRKEPTDQELTWATEIDFVTNVALLACALDSEQERIIGVGRYVIVEGPNAPLAAEVAFVVEEDFQGLGIASMLLRHLAAIARGHGVLRFEADVHPVNMAMLKVFERCGIPTETKASNETIHLTVVL